MRRLIGALLIAGVAAAAIGMLGGGVLWLRYNSAGPLAGPKQVVVTRGGTDSIAAALTEAGVLGDPFTFAVMSRLDGTASRLKAGEYVFPARVSPRISALIIASGRSVQRRLVVAEGLTSAQVVAILATTEGLEGDTPAPPEGSILPETYFYTWGERRDAVIERKRRAMAELLAELWERREPGLPLRSPAEAVVLASIVEKETGKADERARVASVFLNRLDRNMRLQADPTVIYGLTQGAGSLNRPLSRADLDTRHPWNTYVIDGLPPTPIANPGRASLEAVLGPRAGSDLYFVADGAGGHLFARDLAEHNRNVARLRAIERGAN